MSRAALSIKTNTAPLLEAMLRPEEAVDLLCDESTPTPLFRSLLEMLLDRVVRDRFRPWEEHVALAGALVQPRARTAALARKLTPGIIEYICKKLGDVVQVAGWRLRTPRGRSRSPRETVLSYFSCAPIPGELIASAVEHYKQNWGFEEVCHLARALAMRASRQSRLNSAKAKGAGKCAIEHLEALYRDQRAPSAATYGVRLTDLKDMSFSLRTRLPVILNCLYPATSAELVDMAISDAAQAGWSENVDSLSWVMDPAVAIAKHMAMPELYTEGRVEQLMAAEVMGERIVELDRGLARNPELSKDHVWTLYEHYARHNPSYLAGEILADWAGIRNHILEYGSKSQAMGLAIAAEERRHAGDGARLSEWNLRGIAKLALEGLRQCSSLQHGERDDEWPKRRCYWCGNWTTVLSFVYRNLGQARVCAIIRKGREEWAHHFAYLWKRSPCDGPVLDAMLNSANEYVRRQLLGTPPGKKKWQPYTVGQLWNPYGPGRSDPGRKKRGELYREKILPVLARDSSSYLRQVATNLLSQG